MYKKFLIVLALAVLCACNNNQNQSVNEINTGFSSASPEATDEIVLSPTPIMTKPDEMKIPETKTLEAEVLEGKIIYVEAISNTVKYILLSGMVKNDIYSSSKDRIDRAYLFPNGEQVILLINSEDSNSTDNIFMGDIYGYELKPLTDNDYSEYFIDISPDNDEIVFVRESENVSFDIFKLNVVDMVETQLTDNGKYKGFIRWSLDGNLIAYIEENGEYGRLVISKADGSERNILIEENVIFQAGLAWTADSNMLIVPVKDAKSNINLVAVDITNGNRAFISSGDLCLSPMVISDLVVYDCTENNKNIFYSYDLSTGQTREIASFDKYDSFTGVLYESVPFPSRNQFVVLYKGKSRSTLFVVSIDDSEMTEIISNEYFTWFGWGNVRE